MSSEGETHSQPVGQLRQVTIDALCEHFANDVMEVEEFERRVDVAHRATTVDELKGLLHDLPGGNLPAPAKKNERAVEAAPRREFGVTAAAHVKEKQFVVAVMGGATRKGRWSPARTNFAVALMGGAQLDFREAQFGPGVTEVQVFTFCGGVELIVPPGLNVESHGIALLGGFDHAQDPGYDSDPDAPTLRISGIAVCGGVDITVRHPGESSSEARRRRKLERKQRRRLGRGD